MMSTRLEMLKCVWAAELSTGCICFLSAGAWKKSKCGAGWAVQAHSLESPCDTHRQGPTCGAIVSTKTATSGDVSFDKGVDPSLLFTI